MANTIDLNLNVDTEQLKSFVKQLSSFTKLFNKSFKNFLPMGAILGEFEDVKGRISMKSIKPMLDKYIDPSDVMTSLQERMDKFSWLSKQKTFKKLNQQDQVTILSRMFVGQDYEKSSSKLQSVQKELEKNFQDYSKTIQKSSKTQSFFNKAATQFAEKIKTLGLYLLAKQTFDFLRDIIEVRKKLESSTIILSRGIGRFSEFSGNTTGENYKVSQETIKELRSFANKLGIRYGEIETGFAKIVQSIPRGTLSFDDVKSSYKQLLTVFTATGATAQEQASAIRAFTQMIQKGTVSAEEFTRQLGNTSIGGVMLEYALKAYNREARSNLRNFNDLQTYLKANNISSASFFNKVMKEASMDKSLGNERYRVSLEAHMNRLLNALDNLKLGFTKGLGNFSPNLNSITSIFTAITGLINIFAAIIGPINALLFLASGLYSILIALSFVFKKSKFGEFLKKLSYDYEDAYKRLKKLDKEQQLNSLEGRQLQTEIKMHVALDLATSLYALGSSITLFGSTLDSINEKGLTFLNFMEWLMYAIGIISSVLTVVKGIGGFLVTAGFIQSASNPYFLAIVAVLTLIALVVATWMKIWKKGQDATDLNTSLEPGDQVKLIEAASSSRNTYAQVDIRTNFPVEEQKFDFENLGVNVYSGAIKPATNV